MYLTPTYITQPVGNNAFSYKERIALGSTGKLYVPSLKQGTLADLEEGSEICFEEVVNGKLVSCTGLKNFLQTTFHDTPVYMVDNHNHALSFRHKHKTGNMQHETCNLVHIDQHSDIKPNEHIFGPQEDIEKFVNEKTNVGNFITAAVNSGIVNDVIQVRTDYALENIQHKTGNMQPFILDLDIDFRENKEISKQEIQTIREIMEQAELVTIATSPYFIDQKEAIEIVKKLLT